MEKCTTGEHSIFPNRGCCQRIPGWTEDKFDEATGQCIKIFTTTKRTTTTKKPTTTAKCTTGKHSMFPNRGCCEKIPFWTEDKFDEASGHCIKVVVYAGDVCNTSKLLFPH